MKDDIYGFQTTRGAKGKESSFILSIGAFLYSFQVHSKLGQLTECRSGGGISEDRAACTLSQGGRFDFYNDNTLGIFNTNFCIQNAAAS